MDFFSKAMDQAKQIQQIAGEAMQKTMEQAQPMVKDAVNRAQDLQKTLIEQTPAMTAAAQEQYNAALQHAGTMIATGKTVLEAGTAAAQQHLATFADQAKRAADAAQAAYNASRTKPPDPPDAA
jgi:hypothetical protein